MSVLAKICGLTRLEDARTALEAGADFLGFVLYAGSPRAIAPEALAALVARLPASARAVGVFVNERPEVARAIAQAARLFAVQVHGEEAAAGFRDFPCEVWRAVRCAPEGCTPPVDVWPAARYVADAAVPGAYGGTGRVADWEAAAALARRVPVLLAGGLTAGNVAEAIRRVRPAGVDVSSGVETAPGIKDPEKIRAFLRAARGRL